MRQRYGRPVQILSALVSLLYMFISICAEYTSINLLVRTLVPALNPVGPILAVAVSTSLYTMYGGLAASIATDAVQGAVVIIVLIISWSAIWATSATWEAAAYPATTDPVTGVVTPAPTIDQLAKTSGFFDYSCCPLNSASFYGVENFLLLPIGITAAQLFNQGFWQRVWSSRNDAELRGSCYFAGTLFLPVFMIQGIMGMLAIWYNTIDWTNDPTASAAFFSLVNQVPVGIRYLILIMAMMLSSGAVDTQQTGISAIFSNDFGFKMPLAYARIVVLLINAPAIVSEGRARVGGGRTGTLMDIVARSHADPRLPPLPPPPPRPSPCPTLPPSSSSSSSPTWCARRPSSPFSWACGSGPR